MNWYKKARLIDDENKDVNPQHSIFSTCMFCKRWETNREPEWQKILMPDEIAQQNEENMSVSHKMCNYCKEVISTIGYPKTRQDNEMIKEMSMMMN